MTHDVQHKAIVGLMDFARKMKRYDQEEFEMLVKRDKDDEDLDEKAQRRLVALYEQFIGPWGR